MKKTIFYLLLLCGISYALKTPEPSKYDKKITYAVYNAHDVFKISGENGYVTVIEFGKDERVVNVSTGFNEGWELTDRGNLLFIKPKAYTTKYIQNENPEEQNAASEIIVDPTPNHWKTNLIVTTNLNMYVFELVLSSNNKIYKVTFSYPQKNEANIQKLQAELQKQIEEDKLDESLNRVSTPRNWDFYMKVNKGSESIAPNFAYDDGVFTYLGFDNTKEFPAVFSYENGQESILNTHIKKDGNFDVLIIQKIAKNILLRSGDKVVGIFNRGYAKNPLEKAPQTSNDKEVERVLIKEDKGKNQKP